MSLHLWNSVIRCKSCNILKLRIRTTPCVITGKNILCKGALYNWFQKVIIYFCLLLVLLNGSLCVCGANGTIDSVCSTDVLLLALSITFTHLSHVGPLKNVYLCSYSRPTKPGIIFSSERHGHISSYGTVIFQIKWYENYVYLQSLL